LTGSSASTAAFLDSTGYGFTDLERSECGFYPHPVPDGLFQIVTAGRLSVAMTLMAAMTVETCWGFWLRSRGYHVPRRASEHDNSDSSS